MSQIHGTSGNSDSFWSRCQQSAGVVLMRGVVSAPTCAKHNSRQIREFSEKNAFSIFIRLLMRTPQTILRLNKLSSAINLEKWLIISRIISLMDKITICSQNARNVDVVMMIMIEQLLCVHLLSFHFRRCG